MFYAYINIYVLIIFIFLKMISMTILYYLSFLNYIITYTHKNKARHMPSLFSILYPEINSS